MAWARIQDDAVAEIIDFDPAGRFHKDIIWHEAPDGTTEQQTFDGVNFGPIPTPPAPTIKQQLDMTDADLPRWGEDLIDAVIGLGGTVPAQVKAKADNKKALRAQL
jgi:hypothetical protein